MGGGRLVGRSVPASAGPECGSWRCSSGGGEEKGARAQGARCEARFGAFGGRSIVVDVGGGIDGRGGNRRRRQHGRGCCGWGERECAAGGKA